MKKLYLTAAVACMALAGCSNSEDVPTNEQKSIEFAPVNYMNQSRANADFTGTDFGVLAYIGENSKSDINTTVYMDKVKVTKSENTWLPEKTYLWPDLIREGSDLDFFAYAPASAAPTEIVNNGKGGEVKFYFDRNQQYPDKTDHMYADFVGNQTSKTAANGVNLLFHHTLAKVIFKAKTIAKDKIPEGTQFDVTLNSIEVTNLLATGRCLVRLDGSAASSINTKCLGWGDQIPETPHKYLNWKLVANQKLKGDTPEVVTDGQTTMETFAIPQEVKEKTGKKVIVNYTIGTSITGLTDGMSYKTFNVEIPFSKIKDGQWSISQWMPNKLITYTLIIDPTNMLTPITFSPTVEDMSKINGGADVK